MEGNDRRTEKCSEKKDWIDVEGVLLTPLLVFNRRLLLFVVAAARARASENSILLVDRKESGDSLSSMAKEVPKYGWESAHIDEEYDIIMDKIVCCTVLLLINLSMQC